MVFSLASKIPNHPVKCKGVTSHVWDNTQCHLCWLAVYNHGYRRLWGIGKVLVPDSPPEIRYPCVHRGGKDFTIPGCGTCNGGNIAHACHHPQANVTRCFIAGQERQEQMARASGYRVCRECGYREPESGLEMRLSEFRNLLDGPRPNMPAGWTSWRVAHLAMGEALKEQTEARPIRQKNWDGQGIVICAGGPVYFRCAFAVVYTLRKLGCALPIQFWHFSGEYDAALRLIAEDYGIELVDATAIGVPHRFLQGFAIKPFAIYHSRFAEVLSLDADCIPLADPTFLFSHESYTDTGALFWPDIEHPPESPCRLKPDVWNRAGLPHQTEPDFESGQLIINKNRCAKELTVTNWMNEHQDYWYQFLYGDKDTFHIAWRACGSDFSLANAPIYVSPCIRQKKPNSEEVLFHHACQGKGSIIHAHPWPDLPPFNAQCLKEAKEYLEEKRRWLTKVGWDCTLLGDLKTMGNNPNERPKERILCAPKSPCSKECRDDHP